MKIAIYLLATAGLALAITACQDPDPHTETDEHDHHDDHAEEVHLTSQQVATLGLTADTLPTRMMGRSIETTGHITVPPQNEATVTAVVGGNVASIEVIEGETVRQGQALAYLSHPDLIALQTDYLRRSNELDFLEKDFRRKQTLYEEQVGSGKEFQRTESEYKVARAEVRSHEAQLRLMGLNPERIRGGHIYRRVPVPAPIDGSVRKVLIKTGQYVEPRTEMFDLVNTHHVHADLMVFEKDVPRVEVGQFVRFTLGSQPEATHTARIFSVGKSFEEDPKAVHVHAEIDEKTPAMLPGMYIHGRIYTDSTLVRALPRSAVVNEVGTHYIFTAAPPTDPDGEWVFRPVEVGIGRTEGEWMEVRPIEPLPGGTLIALGNAYHLMAEMKKSEAGHSH